MGDGVGVEAEAGTRAAAVVGCGIGGEGLRTRPQGDKLKQSTFDYFNVKLSQLKSSRKVHTLSSSLSHSGTVCYCSSATPFPVFSPSFPILLCTVCVCVCVGKAICCGLCCKGIFGGIRLETHLKHCLAAVANRKSNNNNSNMDNNKLQLQRKKRTKHILFKVTGAEHRLWHSRNPALANKGCALLSIVVCV